LQQYHKQVQAELHVSKTERKFTTIFFQFSAFDMHWLFFSLLTFFKFRYTFRLSKFNWCVLYFKTVKYSRLYV